MRERAEELLGQVIKWSLVAVTLAMTPTWTLDPINPIKMLLVSSFGFMGIAILLVNKRALQLNRVKAPLIMVVGFICWQLVVVALSGGETMQQIFGTNGRNTGLITYFGFSALFVVAIFASTHVFLNRFLEGSLIVGVASLCYGLIQSLGADPFEWNNPYAPVFGFLGNPNFQSSLLGILAVIVFAQIFSSSVKNQLKFTYLIYIFMSLYVIRETDSQQGFLVFLFGSAGILGIYIFLKSRAMILWYLSLGILASAGVLLGILNKGPLASLLYKDSVTYRGDYWRAGWKMTVENPIFGVGLDSYGDWYRRSRTLEATLRRGPDVTSNAAHNVFLDISAYGGFPLLLIYLALMLLVVISAVKVIKRSQGFNAGFVGLVGGWVAFQAQAIISINQIGLALWGWVLSGLIIGYEINSRTDDSSTEKKKRGSVIGQLQSSPGTPLAIFVGLIVGVLVGIPPYLASAKYKGALESTNPQVIQQTAYIWPVEPTRMIQVALTLNDNKLENKGLEIALDAAKRFPDNYAVWATLHKMIKATETQKIEALSQMKRLDPFNPTLK